MGHGQIRLGQQRWAGETHPDPDEARRSTKGKSAAFRLGHEESDGERLQVAISRGIDDADRIGREGPETLQRLGWAP